MPQVLVLSTLATKAEEVAFFVAQLAQCGVTSDAIDLSLVSDGRTLDGPDKVAAIAQASARALTEVTTGITQGAEVIVAIGGGTGGEVALRIMRALPITFPKIMVTTLPFDPRGAVADNSIVLVPTLSDIAGLNTILREVFENVALMTAGLCSKVRKGELTDIRRSVGITGLGATEGAIKPLVSALTAQGRETTVFHANGYGGAALARFAEADAFDAIIDLTPHELTRIHVTGAHVDMPTRFSAGSTLPRVVLPGALNFIGLGEAHLMPERYLARPHYAHSGYFTHVKLHPSEMATMSTLLAQSLNALTGPCAVIVPMGGFSHQDRPGGPIEDAALRQICLETLQAQLDPRITVTPVEAHISDPAVTDLILTTLAQLTG